MRLNAIRKVRALKSDTVINRCVSIAEDERSLAGMFVFVSFVRRGKAGEALKPVKLSAIECAAAQFAFIKTANAGLALS
jgi:hypothetical protein